MEPGVAPQKKTSLFTAKALARKSKPVAEDEPFNFSRAKELAAERFAEEERRRRKRELKLKRSEQDAARKRSPENVGVVEMDATTPPKKRKVSGDFEIGQESLYDKSPVIDPNHTSDDHEKTFNSTLKSAKQRAANNDSLSTRYAKSLLQKSGNNAKPAVSLNNREDGDSGEAYKKRAMRQPIVIDSDDEHDSVQLSNMSFKKDNKQDDAVLDEEEEFPELVAQARERERVRLEQMNKSFSEKNHSQDNHDSFGFDTSTNLNSSVEILITSEMDGAVPLRVKRKMSQKLREARFAWCDRQTFPQFSTSQLRSAIFLTWKREKVYDYTTCQALGLKLEDMDSASDMAGTLEGKVHLEAWTEEAYANALKADNDDDNEYEEVPVTEEVKIKLVMKAKDVEPVKLLVRKSTVLSKLLSAFRQAREIPEEKEISLFFDGDELNLDGLVEDTELDDMDNVEVHIK